MPGGKGRGRARSGQGKKARAGFALGPDQGLELFQAVIDHPEGLWVGRCDPETNLGNLATPDGRIHLSAPEFQGWLQEIDPAVEKENLKGDERYPFILVAGRHWDVNANTNMRNPAWNKGRRACTLLMHPADAEEYGFSEGQAVRVVTEAGAETIEVEVSDEARQGQVVMPHDFGLVYDGVPYGANVNRLTKNTYRDRVAATPLHRYVLCRVEAV